jgi:hypothetical protein
VTTQRKFEIGGAAGLAVLMLLFAVSWLRAREDNIRAAANAAADAKVVAASQQAIVSRDALATQYANSLTAKSATITTPAAAVQVIEHYLPAAIAQQPIAVVKTTDLPADVQKELPVSPSFAMLTPDQVQQVAKDELACDATQNTLTACKADIGSMQTQLKATSDEAAQWKTAAKGGTKWQRFGRIMKSVACAGAGAGAGALVDKQNAGIGAAIGGAGGVAACSMF